MSTTNVIPSLFIQKRVMVLSPPPIKISSNSSKTRVMVCRASMAESFDSSIKRMEQAWLISQQPMPVSCSSCDSKGHVDCKWCGGTGFFIIGDNMLCQVPSRNTSCVICAGKVKYLLVDPSDLLTSRLERNLGPGRSLPSNIRELRKTRRPSSELDEKMAKRWLPKFLGIKTPGLSCCSDCKGTGFRAKWLEEPPVTK